MDQGYYCGSCWAFASMGGKESVYLRYQGLSLDLSEQQLIDCDSPPNYGCDGGFEQYALDYAVANGSHYEVV